MGLKEAEPHGNATANLMPLVPIKLRPGIVTTYTPTLNEGGWSSGQNIRFFQNVPQKDGGWITFANIPQVGVPLAMKAWTGLSGLPYLAIAGTTGLYVYLSGVAYNLSPTSNTVLVPISLSTLINSQLVTINDTVNMPLAGTYLQVRDAVSVDNIVLAGAYFIVSTVPGVSYTIFAPIAATSTVVAGGACRVFTTVAGLSSVSVSLPSHGLSVGSGIQILNPLSIGGITLSGVYPVISVPGPNNFVIAVSPIPTSSQTVTENSNNIAITFFTTLTEWADFSVSNATVDNWGEFLMACSEEGPVFVWQPAQGTTNNPATIVPSAPVKNRFMFVASQEQMLVVCGTIDRLTQKFDPMLMRWCNVSDYTDWIPLATNQAGSFRLAIGSTLRAGIALPGQNLIWTDISLYSMQYIQPPLVWGFQPIGINCGADGPHAVGILGGVIYWKNRNQFMVLADRPQVLECPVWDDVFVNQDPVNLDRVVCETNSFFGEIGWTVPQTDGSFISARMKVIEGQSPQWTVSKYHHHTAWIDQNVFGAPIGGHENGYIDQHDMTHDGAGVALPVSLTSGMVMISEGDQTTFVREIVPDIKWIGTPGTVNVTVSFFDYPNKPPRIKGPVPMTATSQILPGVRGRGRQLQFTFASNDLGTMWRLGNIRYRGQPDGKR